MVRYLSLAEPRREILEKFTGQVFDSRQHVSIIHITTDFSPPYNHFPTLLVPQSPRLPALSTMMVGREYTVPF